MYPINRALITVRAKSAFVDWINSHPDAGDAMTLEQVNREPNAYLIEEYLDDEQRDEILRDVFLDIFFHEMWSWYTDEESAATAITFEMFNEWFTVESSSLVLDLYEDPIVKEEEY
ncbi:hypothetical protein ACFL6C_02500 [Myxococcota bacterium]